MVPPDTTGGNIDEAFQLIQEAQKNQDSKMDETVPLIQETLENQHFFVAARLRECRMEVLAREKRLKQVDFNAITKGLPTLFASLAGVALFAEEKYKTYFDIATTIAAVCTAIHTAAGCDEYQAELREKKQMYNFFARRYEGCITYTWRTESRI